MTAAPSPFRRTASLVLGFLVFYCTVFVAFTAIMLLVPADSLFEANSFSLSTLMHVLSPTVIFVAGFAGGSAATLLGRERKAAFLFAAIVLILGLISLLFSLTADAPAPAVRTGDESPELLSEMAQKFKTIGLVILEPAAAIAGILMAAIVVMRRRSLLIITMQPVIRP
jgi:hypothetical protein